MADFNRSELDSPLFGTRKRFKFDDDAIGAYAEKVARFFGTGQYLFWQTIFVIVWIFLNIGGWAWWSWDPYPFILLNLAFSTQAAYAAPLILLAQNRQEDRDKHTILSDRRRSEETKADTEFLARELAGVRLALGDTVTRDYLRHELEDLRGLLERIEAKLDDESASRIAERHEQRGSGAADLSDPTQGDVAEDF
ncbi:DUF1003 domain-containing protein [Corynebacterium crudilactis]|uniref:DUF1003 domain-containing protein n=1 Tax=Corynebacterium crudilactis TaxID=1652495 RepID=A0A172QSQ1_9CORY|nr:DUF1003 domain-containing protein [Corynebacterium crudilactis]ANE03704.1 hypothetical protein ccrud_05425 [Corynebacterium crudilactis]